MPGGDDTVKRPKASRGKSDRGRHGGGGGGGRDDLSEQVTLSGELKEVRVEP